MNDQEKDVRAEKIKGQAASKQIPRYVIEDSDGAIMVGHDDFHFLVCSDKIEKGDAIIYVDKEKRLNCRGLSISTVIEGSFNIYKSSFTTQSPVVVSLKGSKWMVYTVDHLFIFQPTCKTAAADKESVTTLETDSVEAPSEPESPTPSKLYCPHCGKEIVKRENKTNGMIFYGHKYYNHKERCRVTYNTLEDFQNDWKKVNEKKEEEQRKKQNARNAWNQVVQKQQELFAAYQNKKD